MKDVESQKDCLYLKAEFSAKRKDQLEIPLSMLLVKVLFVDKKRYRKSRLLPKEVLSNAW
jgi:hypothetical protein